MADNSKKLVEDLKSKAENLGIKYFLAVTSSFSSDCRGCVIPLAGTDILVKHGFPYFPFGHFKVSASAEKCNFKPDLNTLIQLPWKPEVGWLQCNMQDSQQCPRTRLISLLDRAKQMGFVMKTGVETEFTLLQKDKHKPVCDPAVKDMECYQNVDEAMNNLDFNADLIQIMTDLGWEPYQCEQEAVRGQVEINYSFAEALVSADRHMFYKFMVKEMAKKHGIRATFMPFPFADCKLGNGLHINISLWDATEDRNLFPDGKTELGLSTMAQHFTAGILQHMNALTALLCPQINSYKRLQNSLLAELTGGTSISWGVSSRFPSIRISGDFSRIEVRLGDAAANPYVAHAALLAAGLDGIDNKLELDPKLRLQQDLLVEAAPPLPHVPRCLTKACECLRNDKSLSSYLGEELVEGYLYCKSTQMAEERRVVSTYEERLANDY